MPSSKLQQHIHESHSSTASRLRLFAILSLFVFAALFAGCSNREKAPNVSGIKTEVKITRFDRDFFSIDTTRINASLDTLYRRYPSFLPVYFEYLSPINFIVQREGKPYAEAVLEYYRNMKPLQAAVDKKFTSVDRIQDDLSNYLRYVKHYYDTFKTPAVITTVESLNPENKDEIYGALYFRDTAVISLQMFMGKNYEAYDPTRYFDYLRRRFEPEYIVPNTIRAIVLSLYPEAESNKLIEIMIEKGKQWWLMDKFMPGVADSLKTGFTGQQVEWCRKHEGDIWAAVLQNTPDIYTADLERIQNYLGEAPRTNDLPEESPGNIGQWIGWQILKKFEEKNSSLSVQQVLATPAARIFTEAKYRPK